MHVSVSNRSSCAKGSTKVNFLLYVHRSGKLCPLEDFKASICDATMVDIRLPFQGAHEENSTASGWSTAGGQGGMLVAGLLRRATL